MPWRAAAAATRAGSISGASGSRGAVAGVDSSETNDANRPPVAVPIQRAGASDVTT